MLLGTASLKVPRLRRWLPRLTFICIGLAYLHAQKPKIIHRDLKSGNILLSLTESGDVARVKITGNIMGDFALLINQNLDFDASAITNHAHLNMTVIGTVSDFLKKILRKF